MKKIKYYMNAYTAFLKDEFLYFIEEHEIYIPPVIYNRINSYNPVIRYLSKYISDPDFQLGSSTSFFQRRPMSYENFLKATEMFSFNKRK